MKKSKLVLLILLLMPLMNVQNAAAAGMGSVKNVRFTEKGNKYVISYDLKDDAVVSLVLSYRTESGKETRTLYELDKKESSHVTGDVGYVKAGTNKSIEWDKMTEDGNLLFLTSVENFKVTAKNIYNPVKTTFLGTFGYSFAPGQMSYGLLIGLTSTKNGWGGFVHFRSNFNFGMKTSTTCDADGKIDGLSCFYTGETKYFNMMANGGVMYNLLSDKRSKSMLTLGLGVGYGQSNVYWQMDNNDWALNKALANSGVSAELNMIGSIKCFTLMAGVNTINFKNVGLEVGIGVTF